MKNLFLYHYHHIIHNQLHIINLFLQFINHLMRNFLRIIYKRIRNFFILFKNCKFTICLFITINQPSFNDLKIFYIESNFNSFEMFLILLIINIQNFNKAFHFYSQKIIISFKVKKCDEYN